MIKLINLNKKYINNLVENVQENDTLDTALRKDLQSKMQIICYTFKVFV
jgi:hypothetical protein